MYILTTFNQQTYCYKNKRTFLFIALFNRCMLFFEQNVFCCSFNILLWGKSVYRIRLHDNFHLFVTQEHQYIPCSDPQKCRYKSKSKQIGILLITLLSGFTYSVIISIVNFSLTILTLYKILQTPTPAIEPQCSVRRLCIGKAQSS